MKILRIVIALVLTAAILYAVRTNTHGRSEFITATNNSYSFEFNTIPQALELTSIDVDIKIDGPFDSTISAIFRLSKYGQDITTPHYRYTTVPMTLKDSASHTYTTIIQTGKRGQRVYYFFEVRDKSGGLRALFVPDKANAFTLQYVGAIPVVVLGFHIFFLAATIFLLAIVAWQGLDILTKSAPVKPMSKTMLWAVVCTFLGAYPLGFMMNHYGFGGFWEAVPFGTNATDNKTQLLFVYMLMVLFASIGSLTGGKMGRDVYSPKVLGRLGIISFFLLVLIYLIPHSIQFSPILISVVCYSFIALTVLIYLIGWFITREKQEVNKGKKSKRVAG